MNTKTCLIRKYELSESNQGVYLYTPEISAKIKNKKMISLLNLIKNKNIMEINDDVFDNMLLELELTPKVAKEYLQNELKILSYSGSDKFDELLICTNDNEITESIAKYFEKGYDLQVYTDVTQFNISDKTLIVAFQKNYQQSFIDNIYQLSHAHNSWVITSYVVSNHFIIDNMFNDKKGMPCHFCNLNRHKNIIMSQNNLKKTSWINYCREIFNEKNFSLPSIPISHLEKWLILFWLVKRVKSFVNPYGFTQFVNDVSQYHWINLLTGDSYHEQAVHWPFCTCQDKECRL